MARTAALPSSFLGKGQGLLIPRRHKASLNISVAKRVGGGDLASQASP